MKLTSEFRDWGWEVLLSPGLKHSQLDRGHLVIQGGPDNDFLLDVCPGALPLSQMM